MLYCFNFGSAMLTFQSLSLIEKFKIVFYQFMHGNNHFLMFYFYQIGLFSPQNMISQIFIFFGWMAFTFKYYDMGKLKRW